MVPPSSSIALRSSSTAARFQFDTAPTAPPLPPLPLDSRTFGAPVAFGAASRQLDSAALAISRDRSPQKRLWVGGGAAAAVVAVCLAILVSRATSAAPAPQPQAQALPAVVPAPAAPLVAALPPAAHRPEVRATPSLSPSVSALFHARGHGGQGGQPVGKSARRIRGRNH